MERICDPYKQCLGIPASPLPKFIPTLNTPASKQSTTSIFPENTEIQGYQIPDKNQFVWMIKPKLQFGKGVWQANLW
jgi:hypothetical protein